MRFDTLRVSASHPDNGLSDAITRSIASGGRLNIESLRATGFRMMEQALDQPEFRAAAPLPERSQVVIDQAVINVGFSRLQFVAALIQAGLTYSLPDAMSIPFLETEKMNKVGAPIRTMNPEARGEDQLPAMSAGRLPIYITKDQFSLGIRELGMSRRVGLPLDTALIEQKTRAVNEAIEDAAINGATTLDGQALYVGGYNAPGLLNAPDANVATLTNTSWTGSSPVGATVMAQINSMMAQLIADNKRGPYTLFVPPGVDQAFNLDFKANGDASIRARVEQMSAGGRPLNIVLVDNLPATKVALVQMTRDVVDVVDGIRPTVVPYTSATGFTFHNIVMAIIVPRFRSDYDGNSGIVIGTLT